MHFDCEGESESPERTYTQAVREPAGGFKARTFLRWDNGGNRRTTVLDWRFKIVGGCELDIA